MAYNHFESSQTPPVFAAADSHYQLPSSFPMSSPREHHIVDGGYFGSDYAAYHERQGSQGMGLANTEESDTASRSRLTQEQLAHLEREFQQRFKPNTEYKRGLAESMGVEYQKVNVSSHYCVRITSHIDISRRIGFRIVELKRNIRPRTSRDLIYLQMKKPATFQTEICHPVQIECINRTNLPISLHQSTALT